MRTFPSFIGGQWLEGPTLHQVTSPYDGSPVGAVHVADASHIEAALAAARKAREPMAALPAHRRRAILDHVAAQLRLRRAEFAKLLSREAGKPIDLAMAEVMRAEDVFTFASDETGRHDEEALDLGVASAGEGRYGVIRRFPVGVVAAITPFNFPLNLVAHKIAPAIAAGCPIIVKPSPHAPLSAFALAELCCDAGLPSGGVNVVLCSTQDADPLVTDPRVHLLTFTGSVDVGWQLRSRAGKKRVVLELGGNAAVLVHADADVKFAAARIASGAFAYAGQSCISVQRVYVHRSQADALRDALIRQVRDRVPTGSPDQAGVVCGPVIDTAAADRLEAWTQEAVAAGARIIVGGGRTGNIIEPTVLEGVPHHVRIAAQEAFGPIVCVEAYHHLDDALHWVNDSPFGLQAGVFTDSLAVLWRAYETLEVGAVIHNDVPTFRVDHMPYGGVKDSGVGREGPRDAIRDYTEPRLLALRPFPPT
jgi:glyceraldehyde-3-phosphate dehydrogenase (NADP+)